MGLMPFTQAAMEITKPGVHWDTVHYTCHKILVQGFQRLGIFKTPDSPSSGSWNSEESILASGDSAAFFPHGLGHSLGMDVHDVPSASKPTINPTIAETAKVGNSSYYTYLRLRLPLEKGMVVVRISSLKSEDNTDGDFRPSSRDVISLRTCWLRFATRNISTTMF